MRYPNLNEEKKLWREGYKRVVCLDEAGRGPLAGPVVAAAVVVNPKSKIQNLKIKDSKKLSPKKREEFYQLLTKNSAIEWGIGRTSEKVIDKINILEATKLAMKRAISSLEKNLQKPKFQKIHDRRKSQKTHDRGNFGKIDFLILDGKMKLEVFDNKTNLMIPQKSIIKADEKVFSCAAASILAKVTRDRIMRRLHKKYPQYGFDKHKGYPTKLHRRILKKYNPSAIHRKTFAPVKKLI